MSTSPFQTRRGFQTIGNRKPPETGTRCTYVNDDGEVCDAFPSWLVHGTRNERRCEKHRKEQS